MADKRPSSQSKRSRSKPKITGRYQPTLLSILCLIKPALHKDERGVFRRSYCEDEFAKQGINFTVKQGNISENYKKHTLRGFHYQIGKHAEAKTISCLNGKAYDIICDLRPNSQTYLKWVSVIISSENRKSIHIPKGCSNAFLTLENEQPNDQNKNELSSNDNNIAVVAEIAGLERTTLYRKLKDLGIDKK